MSALITLAEYRIYAEVNSNQRDNKLDLLIELISDLVRNYCGRSFNLGTYTDKLELLDGIVFPKEMPVTAITSVEYFSYLRTWDTIDASEYLLSEEDSSIQIFKSIESETSKAIRVTYTGGYLTLPSDLKLAILDLVTYYDKREFSAKKIAAGQTVDHSNTVDNNFPPHIKRILDLYRILE